MYTLKNSDGNPSMLAKLSNISSKGVRNTGKIGPKKGSVAMKEVNWCTFRRQLTKTQTKYHARRVSK